MNAKCLPHLWGSEKKDEKEMISYDDDDDDAATGTKKNELKIKSASTSYHEHKPHKRHVTVITRKIMNYA